MLIERYKLQLPKAHVASNVPDIKTSKSQDIQDNRPLQVPPNKCIEVFTVPPSNKKTS